VNTIKFGTTTFQHDEEPSSPVKISVPAKSKGLTVIPATTVEIPMSDILDFVAAFVREVTIADLMEQSTAEILGLPPEEE